MIDFSLTPELEARTESLVERPWRKVRPFRRPRTRMLQSSIRT